MRKRLALSCGQAELGSNRIPLYCMVRRGSVFVCEFFIGGWGLARKKPSSKDGLDFVSLICSCFPGKLGAGDGKT